MNRIVVARGDETGGWVLDYDAAAWGQLTITERTQVIFDEKLQRWMADHYQNQTTSYFDRLLKGLDDERLKKAVLAAWAMIPAQEQEIVGLVEALGQPCLLGLGEHRIAIRCLDIGIDAADGRDGWESQGMGHSVLISFNIRLHFSTRSLRVLTPGKVSRI